VRSYLLGILDERDAEALELQYFSDARFLHWMKEVERELIEEYFENQLPATQRALFEERYRLKIPELREQRQRIQNTGWSESARLAVGLRWRYAWGALALAVVVVSPLVLWRLRSHPSSPASTVVLAVRLVPGITKGAGSKTNEFVAPRNGRVRFSLELPGRTSPIDCKVTLATVDNQAQPVWTSAAVTSRNQGVDLEIEARLLGPGDYLVRAETTNGDVLETYFVRVLPSVAPAGK
jgi:hypothetical protein